MAGHDSKRSAERAAVLLVDLDTAVDSDLRSQVERRKDILQGFWSRPLCERCSSKAQPSHRWADTGHLVSQRAHVPGLPQTDSVVCVALRRLLELLFESPPVPIGTCHAWNVARSRALVSASPCLSPLIISSGCGPQAVFLFRFPLHLASSQS